MAHLTKTSCFLMSWKYKTHIGKSGSRREEFSSVSHLRYMSWTTTHASYDQVNILVLVFVLYLGSKAV